LALVCAAGNVSAATITFSARTTDSEETKTLPGNPCDITQELTKVVITSSARGFGDYDVTNISNTSPSLTTVNQNLVELSLKVPGLPGGEVLIDESVGPLQTVVNLNPGQSAVVNPSFDETFSQPPPVKEFTTPVDLAWFDVATFDVNFKGDAEDSCVFSTGNSKCDVHTEVEGSVTVTYECTNLEPALQCDSKTLNPAVLNSGNGVVSAAFTIRNTGQVDFIGDVEITDTMDAKMALNLGTVAPIGNPVGGPPVYTWSGLSLAQAATLDVTYQATITGLAVGETVCNTVVASATGATSNQCAACVTRPGEPPPVPAIGPMGIVLLGGALSGLGLLFGFRRRG
jgi:hypothetical protein